MPYLTKKEKEKLDRVRVPQNGGELNYLITKLIRDYIGKVGFNDKLEPNKLNYQAINDVLGALEGAKLEYYRRIGVPYENMKLSINGDVYDADS